MDSLETLKSQIIGDIQIRIFEESFPRIRQCLSALELNEIWKRPNENSNSIGNLVLHLCGNIRQYIVSGLTATKDVRKRSFEFSEIGPISANELILKLDQLELEVKPILQELTIGELIREREVQGFKITGTSILIHVTEHLSYHTGQIAFYTKALKNMDLKFYGDLDLDVLSS